MAWFLTFLLWTVVYVAADLLMPKPRLEDARPASLGDFNFPTATEGRTVPIVWGRVRLNSPNVVWYGNIRYEAIEEEVQTGLFSSEDVTVGFRYFVTMQMALCRGPVDRLDKIYIDEVLSGSTVSGGTVTYSVFQDLGGDDVGGNGRIQGNGTFHAGSLTEAADSLLASFQDPLPAYRGTAYVTFDGTIGNSPSVSPWSFEVTRIPDGLNLAVEYPGSEIVNGQDCNPMNAIYEIMTDVLWGLKISSSLIDLANFREAASILAMEGNGFSMVLDNAIEADKMLSEIQRQIDGSLYFDRALGLWRMLLIRDDYVPELIPLFDEDNILKVLEYSRTTWEETSNQIRVAFNDSADNFKATFALAQDSANAEIQGGNVASEMTFPGVKNRTLANNIAWRELSTLSYPLAKVSLRVNRSGFSLVPGSVFRFSNIRLGISEVVFRLSRINYGTLTSGEIDIFAVQDIFSTGFGVFGEPVGTGWTDPIKGALPVVDADTLAFEAPRQLVVAGPILPDANPRVWAGARTPGEGTSGFQMYSKFGPTRPISAPYEADDRITRFILRGTTAAVIPDFATSATLPVTSHVIKVNNVDPDDLSSLEVVGGPASVSTLKQIIYVDGEFIGYEVMEDVGGGVFELQRLYRGLFNSAQREHASGVDIWFLAGNITERVLADSDDEMDLQLRSFALGDEILEGDTPVREFTLDRRWRMPLTVKDPVLHSSYAPASATLDITYTAETGFTGENAKALKSAVTPRGWRIDDVTRDHQLDLSVPVFLADQPNFTFQLILDPVGTPILVPATVISGTETPVAYILRNSIIEAVGANTQIPSTGRLVVTAKHTPIEGSTEYTNLEDMEFDFLVTSILQGSELIFGAFVVSTISAVVVFGETGNYTFNIFTALPSSGILEASVDGAAFVTVVSAGNTTGVLAIVALEEVELRFTVAPTSDQFFSITGPVNETGYGVFLS
jgi:hypothetical protein